MRTTLDIDDDVLAAAKELAKAEGKTTGRVISELTRRALSTPSQPTGFSQQSTQIEDDIWPTLPGREGCVVSQEMVNRILEEIDIEDATPWDHAADAPRKP